MHCVFLYVMSRRRNFVCVFCAVCKRQGDHSRGAPELLEKEQACLPRQRPLLPTPTQQDTQKNASTAASASSLKHGQSHL